MDRIATPIKRSKTVECHKCGAAWRIYEDDVAVEQNPDCWHDTEFSVECEACGQRLGVTFVLSFAMKHGLELKTIREKRALEIRDPSKAFVTHGRATE